MKGHSDNKSKCREDDDSDDDEEIQDKIKDRIIKDTVEGLYVINKMLSSDTEDYKRLLNYAPMESNIPEEQVIPRKRRSKESSQLSSSDDYDSSDNEDNQSKANIARENASKVNPSLIRAKEISHHSKSDSESQSKVAKEDKYKPLIKMLELNKTSMAIGDAPVYYNSDGEAIDVGAGLESADLGPSVRNQWGDRVSSRHLARNSGDDSDSDNDLSHLSFKSGNQDKENAQSDSRKRKVNPVNTDTTEKCTGPSRSIKSANGKKMNDKLERSDEVSDVNPLLPPCEFTTATLVMRDVLSRRMRQHHDALFEFVPALGDGKKRVARGSLLPVTSVSQCGGCGCTGAYLLTHDCMKNSHAFLAFSLCVR